MKRAAYATRLAVGPLAALACAGAAHASILYTGGIGETVYGVAAYGAPAQPAPLYGLNVQTSRYDVLLSPGGGYLTANPSIPNNIFQTPVVNPLPLYSFQVGGGNANGPFGGASTLIAGPRLGFGISDFAPGGGSASYAISTYTANYAVGAGGFNGTLGAYLSIGGVLAAAASSSVASAVEEYYVNGVYQGALSEVLAAGGDGRTVDLGSAGAALLYGFNGAYTWLAISKVRANLLAGARLKVVTTVTEYADPSTLFTEAPSDTLLAATGTTLPDFSLFEGDASVPEPGPVAVLGAGLVGVAGAARLRRRV